MSEAPIYYYKTEVEWQAERNLKLGADKLPPIQAGAPPEFKGRETHWSPEHLFVASFHCCYLLTLLAVAESSKLTIVSLSSSATGKLEKIQGSTYQITEIKVTPVIVLGTANDLSRVARILEKAKENCFVSNSIKSRITIEPQIFHQQTPASPCPLGQASPSPGESPKQ
jgi:peroxiredoxin-like protein